MKRVFIILWVCVHFAFAQTTPGLLTKNTEKEWIAFRNLLKQLEKPTQVFVINPQQTAVITAAEGTKFTFSPQSLVYEDGTPVTSEVQVLVKEFYSLGALMSDNLHTKCDEDILQTGGTIYVEAKAEGRPVKMADNQSFTLEMPNKYEQKGEMEMFAGETNIDGKVQNWKLIQNSKAQKVVDMLVNSNTSANPGEVLIMSQKDCELLKEMGYKTELPIKKCELGDNGAEPLYVYPDFLSSPENKLVAKKLEDAAIAAAAAKAEAFKKAQAELEKTKEVFSFSSKDLGWINCDRFLNDKRPKTALYVKTNVSHQNNFLVFPKISAVMQSCSDTFDNIPIKENAILVSISYQGETPYFAMKNITIEENKTETIDLQPSSIDVIKKNMERL